MAGIKGPYARIDVIKPGEYLVPDDGFTCMQAGKARPVQCYDDPRKPLRQRLYVKCDRGKGCTGRNARHYLDGQHDGDGALIGLYCRKEKAQPGSDTADDELEGIAKQIDSLDTDELAAIIKKGELFERARLSCRHGQWLSWLKERLATPESTARRYRQAFRFAKLTNMAASCKLTAETLFLLSAPAYWHKHKLGENARRAATDAVLKAAAKQKIGRKAALAIMREALGPEVLAQPKATDASLAPVSPTEGQQQESEPPAPPAGRKRRCYLAVLELKALFETPQRLAYQSVPGTKIERSNATTPERIAECAQEFANVWPVSTLEFIIECLRQVIQVSLDGAGDGFEE